MAYHRDGWSHGDLATRLFLGTSPERYRTMTYNRLALSAKNSMLIAVLFIIAGCATTYEADGTDAPGEVSGTPGDYGNTLVTTFFATDRNYDANEDRPKHMFGTEPSTLRYGTCEVSIPVVHTLGKIESPSGFFRSREDLRKHIVITRVGVKENKPQFFEDVNKYLDESTSNDSLIFIHGFNVTFEQAAKRTAQMKFDLGFDGAAIFYTWPSKGKTSISGYRYDEERVVETHANLTGFIADYLNTISDDLGDVYFLAHSMGTRALTKALVEISGTYFRDNPSLASRVKGVILAAPDIAMSDFRDELAGPLITAALPITLYASSEDIALRFSRRINDEHRVGDTKYGLIAMEGIETIDASNVDMSIIGHSYYGDNRSVLSDIFYLVHEGLGAAERFGVKTSVADTNPKTWVFER